MLTRRNTRRGSWPPLVSSMARSRGAVCGAVVDFIQVDGVDVVCGLCCCGAVGVDGAAAHAAAARHARDRSPFVRSEAGAAQRE